MRADIGVVIADPTGIGSSAYTHAGHALVYLSNVCAETPVKARLCKPGEQGSMVTIFPNFYEREPYAWNLVPVSLYLEGTMRSGQRLLYGSREVKTALTMSAKIGYLRSVCGEACPPLEHAYWRDLVASTIERDVFVYAVKTTPAQDETAVRWLNDQPNVNHYNGMTHNCAMFAQSLINTLFPHSVRRDILNDLGMMSPKAAARSFSHWAEKRPELGFYSMHFAQKPGSVQRSCSASSGTEAAIHIKKYLIPAAMIGDHEVAGSFFVAYFLTGRFSLYKEYLRYPAQETPGLRTASVSTMPESLQETSLRDRMNGTSAEWASYRRRFAAMAEGSVDPAQGKAQSKRMQARLDRATVSVEGDGEAWLTLADGRRVGIDSGNVLAAGSDSDLALELMTWRVGAELAAKGRMRPGMQEFREDWTLLERAYTRAHATRIADDEDTSSEAAFQALP